MSVKEALRILGAAEVLLRPSGGELHNLICQVGNELAMVSDLHSPVPMRLTCPECGKLHIDEGEFAEKPHHTHACQHCGLVWRPAKVNTVGVQFLPGYRNAASNGG